ncbi:MAG: phosphatase PAP2 family protein [Rikenellaceae bacterium]
MSWDHGLFLWLNFDGGAAFDSAMLFASGKVSWVALYVLILWLIYRKNGVRGMLLALVVIALAVGMADLVAGIFKHTGPLKNLWPSFPVRLRPMYTPELEGLVRVIVSGGQNGTVSAHASTSVAIGVIATSIIGRRWFSVVMWTQVALVCYSRIYLAYHFPQDIILGIGVGVLSGLLMWRVYLWALKTCKRR